MLKYGCLVGCFLFLFAALAQDNPGAPRPPSTDPTNPVKPASRRLPQLTTVYFPPSVPARQDSNLPPNDPARKVESAVMSVRGGPAGYGNLVNGMNGGGVVGVMVFLDGAYTALITRGEVAAGTNSFPFAYFDGDLKFRSRFPIDHDHVWWWGYGGDIAGRGATNGSNATSFLRVQPLAFIGLIKYTTDPATHERRCQFQAFAKAAFGVYDNQSQTPYKWEWPWGQGSALATWARPAMGAEGLINCKTLRVMADAQHGFSLTGDAGMTTQASVDVSKAWDMGELFQMGFFTRAVGVVQWAAPNASKDNAASRTLVIPSVFAGLELRFW